MTLMDAPVYDALKARRRRNALLTALACCLVLAGLVTYFWDWPEEHLVNRFFDALEQKNLPKAFAIWNHDPDWVQHAERYKPYTYGRFSTDWGHASDWGDITSHKIVMAKTVGSGVVVGVDVNGQKTPMFLWVERSNHTLSFSPVELSTE